MTWLLPILTAAAVLAIYLLRPPPRPIVVPTTYLWQRLADKSRPLRERLRWLLSLLLAAAIACSVAWALTRSNFFGADESVKPLAIIIDDSATMAAQGDDGVARLGLAIDQAKRLADSHPGRILVADTAGQLGSPGWSDSESAKEQLDRLRADFSREHRFPPLPFVSRAGDELVSPSGQAGSKPSAMATDVDVHFFTDGVRDFEVPDGLAVSTHSVFSPEANVGITSLSVRAAPDGRVYAYLEVIHTATTGNDVRLKLEEGSVSRLERKLTMAAGELWSGAVDITGWSSPITASVELLSDRDALVVDDKAWLLAPESQATRILLLADRDDTLRIQLEALPRALIRSLSSTQLYRQSTAPGFWQDFDLMIAEGSAPSLAPPIPTWWINPPSAPYLPPTLAEGALTRASRCRLVDTAKIAEGMAIDWSADWLTDQLTSLRSFAHAPRALNDGTASNGSPLEKQRSEVVCDDQAIMISGLLNGHRQVLQAFDPFAGEARPDRTSIALIGAVTAWLRSQDRTVTVGSHLLPGNLIIEAGTAGTDPSSYLSRSEAEETDQDRGAVWASIERPGLFRVEASDSRSEPVRIAANLVDRSASQINASALGEATGPESKDDAEVPPSSIPWRLLLIVAFALCLAEWHTYRRRITI
jgi:hypothetical protein